MRTARELAAFLWLKGKLDSWVGQVCQGASFYQDDDPRSLELEDLAGENFEEAMRILVVLRSEYIEQLLAQQGSDPLVQKLRFVDSIVSNPSHR